MVGGEAATADEVMRAVLGETWTVVVLDINLPGSSGLELLSGSGASGRSSRC